MKKTILSSILFIGAVAFSSHAQVKAPQPSPKSQTEQVVGLTDIKLEYSRPSVNGRVIFGDLVPYGKMWRAGANNCTQITLSTDAKIDGKEIKKGSYAIYVTPNEKTWDIFFYAETSNWGLPEKWEDSKVAVKTSATVNKETKSTETFTISFTDLKSNGCTLNFSWANVSVNVKIEVPTVELAQASIDKAMAGPSANDYYQAASFYLDEGKDLNQALIWIKKAVELRGDAFWYLRKQSLIEAKLGDFPAAIESAKKSLALAKEAGNDDYVKMNEDSIKEWSTKKK